MENNDGVVDVVVGGGGVEEEEDEEEEEDVGARMFGGFLFIGINFFLWLLFFN
jgi:hypothetical protein